MTRVVNLRREACDVYIGRAPGPRGKWGNPFRIGPDGSRGQVLAKHREWLLAQPALLAELPSLRGKRLGCFCKPAPCHGDVLAELAEAAE